MQDKNSTVVLTKKQKRYLDFCDQLASLDVPASGSPAGKVKRRPGSRENAYDTLHPLIEELLSTLSSTEARILRDRFGIDRGYPAPLHKIARRLRMSAREVLRIEENALAKLQVTLMQRQKGKEQSQRWN